MKKRVLLLIVISLNACSKSKEAETCKPCYVIEYVTDAKGQITTTETNAGNKCGDDVEKFESTPAVQTQTTLKFNKCK